jgi:hypothetical protein
MLFLDLQKHVGESPLTVFCFCGSKYQPVLLVELKTFTSTSVGVLDPQDQIEVQVKVIVLCVKCTRQISVDLTAFSVDQLQAL